MIAGNVRSEQAALERAAAADRYPVPFPDGGARAPLPVGGWLWLGWHYFAR
jgi:hypothetical protein